MASSLRFIARHLTKPSLLSSYGASSQLFNISTNYTHSLFDQPLRSCRMKPSLRFYASLPSSSRDVAMPFVRSYIVKMFCPFPFDSFSMYKEETAERLHSNFLPGLEKTEYTRKHICVSLSMPELMIEDVKSYFRHGAFFIEGKTNASTQTKFKRGVVFVKGKTNINTNVKRVHYITCIRLPKNFLKKRNVIKTEMQDGMYKATLSRVRSRTR